MTTPIADRWFEFETLDNDITHIWEPHVHGLVRCNIWHVRGRDRDLIIDSGLGVSSLRDAGKHLFGHRVTAIATHTHSDHAGGLHEFDERLIHPLEADELNRLDGFDALFGDAYDPAVAAALQSTGYDLPEQVLDALPSAGFDPRAFRSTSAPATGTLDEGDVVDVGSRRFEIMHLPGHSPGSIGLWEAETGTLFSGDAVYDGPLLDVLPRSDKDAYVATMKRLQTLPVNVVHAGHDPSFGRERLRELASDYLAANA